MTMDRTSIINHLIKTRGYKSYLEIGIQHCVNWDQIDCIKKTGIEPYHETGDARVITATSDQFFAADTCQEKFDIVFIDGDHHEDTVYRDIKNSLFHLENGGTIVLHDSFPPDRRHTSQGLCGTVYRAIWRTRLEGNVSVLTYAGDYGVCLMRKSDESAISIPVGDYDKLCSNTKEILNLKLNSEDFLKELEFWNE